MAQSLVANVAAVARVSREDTARVLAHLPALVSSAAGELGLLTLRPSEKQPSRAAKRARRAKGRVHRATKAHARRDRAIGVGLKGDILRSVYVRIALWMRKTGTTRTVPVVATDSEIAALLPLLVGTSRANRVGRSERERRRALSQMAYDWKTVIGSGAQCAAEDTRVDVTFYLAGGDAERRFWFGVDVRSSAGERVRVIEPPIEGAEPAVSLVTVVEATKVYRPSYMEWAELLVAAARMGDAHARAAVLMIKAARGLGYAIGTFFVAGLLFLAAPLPKLHAQVIDALQRAFGVLVKNETSDYSLPPRLRVPSAPLYADEDITVHRLSPTALVFTYNRTAEVARAAENHRHDDGPLPVDHVYWEWSIRTRGMAAPIFKRTENPQLRVEFGRSIEWTDLISVGCSPKHNESAIYRFGPPGSPPPPPSPMTAAERDAHDQLIIGRPETYDQPTPGSPNQR